ncbi:MAG TPA: hypothetical protein VIH71_10035 [Solirubrobacteraceae bacterium]
MAASAQPISDEAALGTIGPWTTFGPLLSNKQCNSQSGGQVMAQSSLPSWGTDLLVFLSASGWANSPAGLSAAVKIGTSTPQTAVFVNSGAMHSALVRRRLFLADAPPGNLSVPVTAGAQTVTDLNDRVSLVVIQRGDPPPFYVREVTSGPPASGSSFFSTTFSSVGGTLLISAAASGYSTVANVMTGVSVLLDGRGISNCELCANHANSHQAFVPVDLIATGVAPGTHTLALTPEAGTTIDVNDFGSLTVVELLCPPTIMSATQVMANAPCKVQGGSNVVASGNFTSAGGVLLVCVGVSGYTHNASQMLGVSIQIDGRAVGATELYANMADTHLCLTGTDLVLSDIASGSHTIALVANSTTVTDGYDRCSITVIEVTKAAP